MPSDDFVLAGQIEDVQDAVDEISDSINSVEDVVQIDEEPVPFSISKTVKRLWKVIDGVVTESTTSSAVYYRVPRIDISGYNKVRAKFTLTGAIGAVTCFGDENNNLVGSTISVNSGETTLQVPEGAKYFYMTTREEGTVDIYAYGIVSKNVKERYYDQVELNKKYNSHVSTHDVKDASGGLSITDINGHVVLKVKNGHVKTEKFDSQQKLKILILGNSYSLDSFSYLPFILKNYGIDVCVGIYFRASGTLAQLVAGWSSARYYFYLMDTEKQTQWAYLGDYAPKECVEFKDWDIITLQQQSDASHDFDTYEPAASSLINLIYSAVQKSIQLAWNININNKNHSNVSQILTNIENCCLREPINMIFPYGTAIFNARTNEVLDAIGDYGHLWYEGTHLQEGLPCYIAALANTQAIFNKFYPKYTVANEKKGVTITQEMINGWNVRGQHGTCTGISEDNCRLAQKCAILANKKPFEITTIY